MTEKHFQMTEKHYMIWENGIMDMVCRRKHLGTRKY